MVSGLGFMDGIQNCATYNPRGPGKPAMDNLVRIRAENDKPFCPMASVHNAGKLKFGANENEKAKIDTLEIAANGPREHI
jgi:hypothetical protein